MPSAPDVATMLNYWPSAGPQGLQDQAERPWWPDKETGLLIVDMKLAVFPIGAEGSPDSHRYMPWLEPFFSPVQSTLHGRFLIGTTGFNLWHIISPELHVKLMGHDVSSHLSVMIMSLLPSCFSSLWSLAKTTALVEVIFYAGRNLKSNTSRTEKH